VSHEDLCRCDLCRKRRGCFVVRAPDFDPPPGWVELQKDDSPDYPDELVEVFESDDQATRWFSSAARIFVPDAETPFSAPIDAPIFDGDTAPAGRWRVIVPILEALDAGLLGEDACLVCGDDGADRCDCARALAL
jgi:hypothetical protein